MERAFWRSLFKAAPTEVRGLLEEMQLAMDIGFIMTTLYDGSFTPEPTVVGVLNDSMAFYKVPKDLSVLVRLTSCVPH
jgi:hypothetical protein